MKIIAYYILFTHGRSQGINQQWVYNGRSPNFSNFSFLYSYQNRLQTQRALLLQGTESLNRATQSIERSHRIATETDQIGSEIIEDLGEQRDQLERTKNRVCLGIWGKCIGLPHLDAILRPEATALLNSEEHSLGFSVFLKFLKICLAKRKSSFWVISSLRFRYQ
jgi:hypothetical protein